MKIRVIVVGKTSEKYVQEGIKEYEKRLKRFINYSIEEIPDVANRGKTTEKELKEKEGDLILKKLKPNEYVVLFDDKGKELSSPGLNQWFEKKALSGNSSISFVVGGAYGFSDEVYERANEKLSLSKLTFNHQMVRLIITEQVYRAFSIKHGLPYHH